jgi:hypothetical protein
MAIYIQQMIKRTTEETNVINGARMLLTAKPSIIRLGPTYMHHACMATRRGRTRTPAPGGAGVDILEADFLEHS